jgi:hypothetical protein
VIDAPLLAPFVPVRFASPSGADVPAERAGIGLAVALLLLGAAVLLVRRSDWTPPGGDPFAGVSLGDDPFADVDLDDDYGYEYLVT